MNTRRDFIKGGVATGFAIGVGCGRAEAEVSPLESALRNALMSGGFDLARPGAVVAVIADAHIFLGSEYPAYRTESYDTGLIDEINSLKGTVSEFVVAGDLISYHTMAPGIPPYQKHEAWARQEYELAVQQIGRFNYTAWMVPGNHDTSAEERCNAEMFREYMKVAPYQKTVMGGVPVFFLNSGTAGHLYAEQEEWLREQAESVPEDQEVLLIVHYPAMLSRWIQGGVKRVITEVFGNHRAPVWLMSGHNHEFLERKFVHNNVTYMQVQTTCASWLAQVFGDRKNPGYAVLGLQDGRVKCRVFRSLKEAGYRVNPPIAQLAPFRVQFPFDDLPWAMAKYEEGFYDRTNRVVQVRGSDVGCYFTYCKLIVLRVDPSGYLSPIVEVAVAGSISGATKPACFLSPSGADGSWTQVVFPEPKGSGLYRIPIPPDFRNEVFFIKLDTGLTGTVEGFAFSGWSVATEVSVMTQYERWLLARYGTLEKTDATRAASLTPGTAQSNLMNCGFNLLPVSGEQITGEPLPVAGDDGIGGYSGIRYARMVGTANPGVGYDVECSEDLKTWLPLPEGGFDERILREQGIWEEVEIRVRGVDAPGMFYRVRLSASTGW